MAAFSVLLIDDDADLTKSVGGYLTQAGHEVFIASTGEEGLRLWTRHRPHVTICDMVMPGMSGMDVLAGLQEDQAIVIMLTGQDEVETAVEAMRLGAENFLTKPIEMPHLVQALEKAAEKSVLRRETIRLQALVEPSRRERQRRLAVFAVLVIAAAVAGLIIGSGGREEPSPAPIPIPVDSSG